MDEVNTRHTFVMYCGIHHCARVAVLQAESECVHPVVTQVRTHRTLCESRCWPLSAGNNSQQRKEHHRRPARRHERHSRCSQRALLGTVCHHHCRGTQMAVPAQQGFRLGGGFSLCSDCVERASHLTTDAGPPAPPCDSHLSTNPGTDPKVLQEPDKRTL